MQWLKSHLKAVLLTVAVVLCGGGAVSAQQMVSYDNFEPRNWAAVLAWLVPGIGAAVAGFKNRGLSADGSNPTADLSGRATLSQVRTYREQADVAKRSAEALNVSAVKAIAALEAELAAAKALMEEPK
ncbi:MAG: hypothetical protein V4719_10170 [Planctomycetota bacterium]